MNYLVVAGIIIVVIFAILGLVSVGLSARAPPVVAPVPPPPENSAPDYSLPTQPAIPVPDYSIPTQPPAPVQRPTPTHNLIPMSKPQQAILDKFFGKNFPIRKV